VPKIIHESPSGPEPLGPYAAATEANGFVFVSGQVAVEPATGLSVGDDIVLQTRRVMENIGAVLSDVGLGFDDIVKTTIFLASIDDFPAVNDVYAQYVGASPPARATVQAGALPGGFRVEIEVVAAR